MLLLDFPRKNPLLNLILPFTDPRNWTQGRVHPFEVLTGLIIIPTKLDTSFVVQETHVAMLRLILIRETRVEWYSFKTHTVLLQIEKY